MLLNINLGSDIMTSLSVGSLLDDNIWHDVVISRNRKDIVFSVDRVMIQGRIKGEFNRLNLNREVIYAKFLRCNFSKLREVIMKSILFAELNMIFIFSFMLEGCRTNKKV